MGFDQPLARKLPAQTTRGQTARNVRPLCPEIRPLHRVRCVLALQAGKYPVYVVRVLQDLGLHTLKLQQDLFKSHPRQKLLITPPINGLVNLQIGQDRVVQRTAPWGLALSQPRQEIPGKGISPVSRVRKLLGQLDQWQRLFNTGLLDCCLRSIIPMGISESHCLLPLFRLQTRKSERLLID